MFGEAGQSIQGVARKRVIDQKDFDILMKEIAVHAPVEFRDVLKKLGFRDVRDVIEHLARKKDVVVKSDLGYHYAGILANEDSDFIEYIRKHGDRKRYALTLRVLEENEI